MAETHPDWAALYSQHREAMYLVAQKVLRDRGMTDQASDAVQEAMRSLMDSPPTDVRNWQAIMVTAAKRKALDILRSAAVKHAGPELDPQYEVPEAGDLAEEVAEAVDRKVAGAVVWDLLGELDERQRLVAWEYIAKSRPRAEVAAELGVTPARVSQIAARVLEVLKTAMSREQVTYDEE